MTRKKTLLAALCLAVLMLAGCHKGYDINIKIPADATRDFIYSDTEVTPKDNFITLKLPEGSAYCTVLLRPAGVQDEISLTPYTLLPGEAVKIPAVKGAWYCVGVNNTHENAGRDITFTIQATDAGVRVREGAGDMGLY